MAYTDPTLQQFQAYFNRDFPYGNADLTTVQDADINKALSQQQNTINPTLFANQNLYTQGALLLAAHFLVLNLRASSQGIAGKFDWATDSKSVGAVAASFGVPEEVLNNPQFQMICSTTYGVQFFAMIYPLLSGQMFAVAGGTVGQTEGSIFSGVYGQIGPWGSGG